MPRPFEGLRVVDLSDRLSGAFAARLFGDFGADVILVEGPEGHPLRTEPPFLDTTGSGNSAPRRSTQPRSTNGRTRHDRR